MNIWKTVAVIAVTLLAGMFLVSRTAHAHELTYWECYAPAHTAMATAEMKQEGATQGEALKAVMQAAHKAFGEENSVVQDEEDVKGMINLVNSIYTKDSAFDGKTPGMVYDLVFQACIKGKEKPKSL